VAGQLSYTHRAMPVFLSIQLTHVSCRVTESGLEAVNPQFRGLARVFCSYSAEADQPPAGRDPRALAIVSGRPGLSRDSATRNRQRSGQSRASCRDAVSLPIGLGSSNG
jgi:hypothetical protein